MREESDFAVVVAVAGPTSPVVGEIEAVSSLLLQIRLVHTRSRQSVSQTGKKEEEEKEEIVTASLQMISNVTWTRFGCCC